MLRIENLCRLVGFSDGQIATLDQGTAILYTFLYYMGKFGMTQKIFFLFFGIIIWYLFLQSGIHSTISGVILAFVIPARPRLDAGKYIRRIRAIVSSFPVVQSDNIVLTNEQIATLKQVERASDRVISIHNSPAGFAEV